MKRFLDDGGRRCGTRGVFSLCFHLAALGWMGAAIASGATPASDEPSPDPGIATERTRIEWRFSRNGTNEGWIANAHVSGLTVSNGVLSCRTTGPDPILELQPRLEIPLTPWQVVEIRLRADHDGMAELFWSPTDRGPFGGFSQERAIRFPVHGDGVPRTYRLRPFWQADGRLRRLRFDLYDGTSFAWSGLRIADTAMPPAMTVPEFDFDWAEARSGWQGIDGARWREGPGGAAAQVGTSEGLLLGPPVDFEASSRTWAGIRLAVDRGRRATFLFATAKATGLQRVTFPIEADGHEHTYNLDLLASAAWQDRIVALALRPSDDPEAMARIRWMRCADRPQGAAELQVVSWAMEETLPRAGRSFTVTARFRNRGGSTASNLAARVAAPEGWEIAPAGSATLPASLAPGADVRWSWRVRGPAGRAELTVRAEASATAAVESRTRVEVTPAPTPVAKGDYIPEPRPVRGPYEVGVYYFPGWSQAGPWEPIRDFPERRPALGWYREGDPEVADWQIKWAVEHGITFFAYDWYWSRGARQLEHGLHDGFLRARFRHLLKFCLLWANHNAPGTSSDEDCLAVTRHWIEHYFRRPEYLRVDGKPVVILFSPDRLAADLGSAGVRAALEAMRRECARSGLGGLYCVACVPDAGVAKQCAAEGYDAVTAYTWPHLGVPAGELFAPFATVLPGYRRQWDHIAETAGIPLVPPVCGGWDSRPWHGDRHFVRTERTPALFAEHLRDARSFLDARSKSAPGTVRPVVLIEAWNEFGEGSYIEPHAEHGFGFLDAVRDVFAPGGAPHEDTTPADVGRGPYEVAFPSGPRTDWAGDVLGRDWTQTMDLAEVTLTNGVWSARSTGNDPALFGPALGVPATDFGTLELRLRMTAERATPGAGPVRDQAQVFWRTATVSESEATSVRFPVVLDGQWHDYQVAVGGNPRWRGQITRLRLDPGNRRDVRIDVARIRLSGPASAR